MASESTWGAVALPKLVRSLKLTLIANYAYFAIEWLFFVTKPSTLNMRIGKSSCVFGNVR